MGKFQLIMNLQWSSVVNAPLYYSQNTYCANFSTPSPPSHLNNKLRMPKQSSKSDHPIFYPSYNNFARKKSANFPLLGGSHHLRFHNLHIKLRMSLLPLPSQGVLAFQSNNFILLGLFKHCLSRLVFAISNQA